MGLKLIREAVEDLRVVVTEEAERPKQLYLEGIFLQAGIKNRNGRVYPPEVMEESVNRYVTDRVKRGNAFGEFGHPNTPSINPERISHRIVSLTREGNNWIGRALVLDEGYGKIARNIIETGGTLGMSSRSLGSLKEQNGVSYVQEGLDIRTAGDIVTDPSAPDAWMTGIMENEEWVLDATRGWQMREIVHEQRKEMRRLSVRQLEEQKLAQFARYLKTL